MPAKGETYNRVNIDLKRWVEDYKNKTGLNNAGVAKVLGLDRKRITEMLRGEINTMKYLQIVVNTAEGGDYLRMGKYAKDDAGMETLKTLDYLTNLTPYERDLYRQWEEVGRNLLKNNPKELAKVLSKDGKAIQELLKKSFKT